MSVTSGFFNSLNHDRRYNAQQMSSIFDGVINDGVFANIGVAFKATAAGGLAINIGEGKAWFNSAWVYNDTVLPLTLEASEVVLDRIDAIVIDVDHNESVRSGDIKIVKGTPSSSPKRPTLTSDAKHKQAPIAYITRKAGSTEITQANITSMIGTSECPYITGILQVQNIDSIVAQWGAQWNEWYAEKIAETDTDASELMAEMKSEFDIWFNDIQTLLEDDVATALAAQVAELQGKFDSLAREGAVYDTIEDSDFDPILGSDGTLIQGKTVFGAGGAEDVDLSGYVEKDVLETRLEEINAVKLNRNEKYALNLLDNSYFINLINQLNGASYTGIAHAYDRWAIARLTVSATENGLNVKTDGSTGLKYMHQKLFQNLCGEKLTIAIDGMPAGGYIKVFDINLSKTIVESGPTVYGLNVFSATIPSGYESGISVVFYFPNNSSSILKWAALYKGEYTVETLPVYNYKGYSVELYECKRYYQDLGVVSAAIQAWGTGGSQASIYVPCGVPLRISPPTINVAATVCKDAAGVDKTITNVAVMEFKKDCGNIRIRLTSDSWSVGNGIFIGNVIFDART